MEPAELAAGLMIPPVGQGLDMSPLDCMCQDWGWGLRGSS